MAEPDDIARLCERLDSQARSYEAITREHCGHRQIVCAFCLSRQSLVSMLRDATATLRRLQATLTTEQSARQLIADVLEERADELDKAACDRCEQCGDVAMCAFHSVLSALQRHTWTMPACERADKERKER